MGEAKSLKERNTPRLMAYVGLHVVVAGWLLLGQPTSAKALSEAGPTEWLKAAGTLGTGLLVALFSRLGTSDLKASLVFLRWRHPLPGSRAFSELAQRDRRVDLHRLLTAVGGAFPTDPGEQNREWYRLFQLCKESEAVSDGHQEYLLFRDTTWLTVLLALLAPSTLWVLGQGWKVVAWDFGACLILLLLARKAAANAGERFVSTVLAVASSSGKEPPPRIMVP